MVKVAGTPSGGRPTRHPRPTNGTGTSIQDEKPDAGRLPSETERAAWGHLVCNAENQARMDDAAAKAHDQAADHFERIHIRLGLGLIVLTALTSASLLQAIGEQWESWQKIVAATLSASATACAAVQTFLKAAEKARTHDRAARAYRAVCGELMGFLNDLTLIPDDQCVVTDAQRRALSDANRRRRGVENEAPRLPKRQQARYEQLVAASLEQLRAAESVLPAH